MSTSASVAFPVNAKVEEPVVPIFIASIPSDCTIVPLVKKLPAVASAWVLTTIPVCCVGLFPLLALMSPATMAPVALASPLTP